MIKSPDPDENIQKWNYRPTRKYLTREKPRVKPKKGNEVTEMTVEKSDDLLSDDIFRNWEEPTPAENMELQKIKNKGNTRNIFDAIGTKNNAVEKFVFPKLSGEIMRKDTKVKNERNWPL